MTLNGVAEGALADDLSNAPAANVATGAHTLTYVFTPNSITLLHLGVSFTPTYFVYLPVVLRQ
jgi:hypothetical protein